MKLIPTRKSVYTIRVIYKSGYAQDFNVLDFSMSSTGVKWESIGDQIKPLKFGFDEIAAVYQLRERKCFFWG